MDIGIELSLVGISLQYAQRSTDANSGSVRAIVVRQNVQTIGNRYDFAYLHSVFCSEFRHALRVSGTILPLMVFPHTCECEHIIKSTRI